MKAKHLLAIIVLVLVADSLPAEIKKACYDTAKTQLDLNNCAALELKNADDELNVVYKEIAKRNVDDKVFLDRLKEAQRAWLKFRDAELEALFPEADKQSRYGSSYSMCYAQWKAKITEERTQQLKKWITGVREGEVCSGSLPVK